MIVALVKMRPAANDYVIRCTEHGIVRIPPKNLNDRTREAHARAAAHAPPGDRSGGSHTGWYKGSRKQCLPIAFLHAIEHDVELTELDCYEDWKAIDDDREH